MKVLLTGADGQIGTHLAPHLRERHHVRLAWWDPAAPPGRPDWARPGDDVRLADLSDRDAVRPVVRGVDAVVHVPGRRGATASWDELLRLNVPGFHNIFEEAAASGVRRVVLASSAHVTGGWLREGPAVLDPGVPVRPDSLCAVTDVFGEAVGRLVSDRWGLSVICLRLGRVTAEPGRDAADAWLSPRDLRRLVDCALAAPVRFGVYNGVSACPGTPWDLTATERDLGYRPGGCP